MANSVNKFHLVAKIMARLIINVSFYTNLYQALAFVIKDLFSLPPNLTHFLQLNFGSISATPDSGFVSKR